MKDYLICYLINIKNALIIGAFFMFISLLS